MAHDEPYEVHVLAGKPGDSSDADSTLALCGDAGSDFTWVIKFPH